MRIAAMILTFFLGLATAAPVKERRVESAQQSIDATSRGTQDAPIFVRGSLNVKKDELEAKNEDAERRFKSEADSKLVQYTGYLAFFTSLLFLVTGFLWWSTWRLGLHARRESVRQSREIEKSISEAVRSADAMEKVAVATVQNAELMSGIMQRQMRAYVSVFVAGATHQADGLRFEIRLTLKNEGLTPARNVAYRSMVGVWPAGIGTAHVFPVPPVEIRNDASLSTRQEFGITAGVLPERLSDDDVAAVMLGRDKRLYAWGTVSYDDIFGKHWTTNFCQNVYWIITNQDGKDESRWFSQYHNSHNDST